MADSNAPSTPEEKKVEMADSNAPSTPEKQKVNMADNNAPSTPEKQKVEMADSNAPSAPEKQKVEMADSNLFSSLENEKIIGTALSEMEYRVQLFNTLSHTCFSKCIDKRYKEGELHLGETSCIERCVAKYNQVNNMVGQLLAYGKHRR